MKIVLTILLIIAAITVSGWLWLLVPVLYFRELIVLAGVLHYTRYAVSRKTR